jgi:PAS domain S-box-containing protein
VHTTIDVTPQVRAEAALRESGRQAAFAARRAEDERKRLEAVLQAVPVGIVVSDARGGIALTNAAHRKLWGECQPRTDSVDEFRLWKGWWADGSGRDGQPLQPGDWTTARALRGEAALHDVIEIESFGPEHVRRICLNSAAQILEADGTVAGAVVAQLDITEQRRVEASLRDTATRLQFTLDAAEIGEWDLDLVSDTFQRSLRHDQCFGYTQQLAHWGTKEFFEHIHPDDRATVRADFYASVAGHKNWHFEARVVWPDGSVHWVAVHGSVYAGAERPQRMAGIIYDITDRKRAELELGESQQQFSKIISQAATGVLRGDALGRITLVNQKFCDMLGYAQSDLMGASVLEITAESSVANTQHVMQALESGQQSFVLEKQYRRRDGSLMWATSSVNALRSHDGAYLGFVAIVVDITGRKQAEEALQETDRRKDEFLAMLAHELRNPLAPISAAAELIGMGRLDPERLKHASGIIARQVRHMTGLVDDLLDVSRVTRGLVTLDKTTLDARAVLSDAVEQVRPLLEARRHHLHLDLPQVSAMVCGDRKRLVQVMTNLLNNAAKYTPDGGNIVLHVDVHGDEVAMSVADDGIGMAPELVQRAFELFAQASRSADRAQGGLGIGLAVVKSLVELHGGSVSAHSEGQGRGSSFTVRLPRLPELVRLPDTQGHQADEKVQGRALKVLIVDDNVDAAQTLALLIEAQGHQVQVEHASHAALESAVAQPPDVCLLDIGLPELDGNALARRLRTLPQTSGAVLVAVTGYGQDQDRKQARDAGFDHHFVKPVDIAKLSSLLRDIAPK